jgi:hypothetical protein
MKNLDQIIMVVKIGQMTRLNCTPTTVLKDYIKIECFLAEENYDLIEEADFFEQLEVDDN